jgi:hypothetical protein
VRRITRNVALAEVRDLLERVPRACVAFAGDEGPRVEPVNVVVENNRYIVGLPSSAASHPAVHQEVALLVDDGLQFFDLRAIYIRGHVRSLDGREGLPDGSSWFTVQPTRVVAWNYGRMREADDEP